MYVARMFLGIALTAMPLFAAEAQAQDFPQRPITFVVGFGAGGGTDINARIFAEVISRNLAQRIVVDNRPGGGGAVAAAYVQNSAPDGHTLLLVTPANLINAALYPTLKFSFVRDIAPVALMTREPNAMVVHPSVPAKSLAEFIAFAKANPGKITMASGGVANSSRTARRSPVVSRGVEISTGQ